MRKFKSATPDRSGAFGSRGHSPARAPAPIRLAGFSLIEMLSVLVILAVLAAAAVPMARMVAKRNKEQDLRYSLRQVREAIDAYKRAADEGRVARKVGESGYPPKLADLVNGVEDLRDPNKAKIYFLRRIPMDPMTPADPLTGDNWAKRSYLSAPDDPREGDDVYDIHSRSEEVGLNQLAYRKW